MMKGTNRAGNRRSVLPTMYVNSWTVAEGLPWRFKGIFLRRYFIPHPHHLLPGSTTFHALNSVQLCYWPISLAMSSGKYLTNASSCLHVPRGLWLQGTLQHQKLGGKRNRMQISYSATSSKTQREEERERQTLRAKIPLFFCNIWQRLQSKRHANRDWLNSWLNQALSVHTHYQDNNLHQWNASSQSKKQASKRIY